MEVLVELRAIQLERMGKMSRYSPLLLLEGAKWVWGRWCGGGVRPMGQGHMTIVVSWKGVDNPLLVLEGAKWVWGKCETQGSGAQGACFSIGEMSRYSLLLVLEGAK